MVIRCKLLTMESVLDIDAAPPEIKPIAFFRGRYDWRCKKCGTMNMDQITPLSWRVRCSLRSCRAWWFIPSLDPEPPGRRGRPLQR